MTWLVPRQPLLSPWASQVAQALCSHSDQGQGWLSLYDGLQVFFAYSTLRAVDSMTCRQRSLCCCTKVAVSIGELPTGVTDNPSNLCATSGSARTSATAFESLEAITTGVFGGATIANHSVWTNPGSVSAMVGTLPSSG